MFDALYPEAADTALGAKLSRPVAAPASTPWFKGFWGAMADIAPRAGAEMGRAGSSLMTPGAAGALDAPSLFSAPGRTSRDQLERELRDQDKALAASIKEFTPNAETTGAASMVLHDIGRFVGKAGAYSLLGGVPAAVAGMTIDDGINEAQRRMDEGVDAATAAKLGLTKGIASGIAVALPVAGGVGLSASAIGKTVGLAALGGPGSFIAEQATAREILRAANYDKLAAEIDPFDPMGLGVSFLGSAIFGGAALGIRRMRAKAKAAEDAALAEQRMLADDRPPGERTPVAQAVARAYSPEQVDAAHVSILQAHRESSALVDGPATSAAHSQAMDAAAAQLAAGEPVRVEGVVGGAEPARAEMAQIEALQAERADLLPVAGDLAERGAIREARAELADLERGAPDTSEAALRALAKQIQEQEGVSYKAALSQARKQVSEVVAEFEAKTARLNQVIESNARAQQAVQRVGEIDKRIAQLEKAAGQRLQLAQVERQAQSAAASVEPKQTSPAARPAPQRQAVRVPDKTSQPATSAAQPPQPEPVLQASVAEKMVSSRADLVLADMPDLLVQLEGMDAPMSASKLIAEIKALAAAEVADAPLLRVAAECALRG